MSNYLQSDLTLALEIIRKGGIVAAPTDTVYGILADATNESAIKKVFEIKKRPMNKPLITLVSSLQMAKTLASFSQKVEDILTDLWLVKKYPITVILKADDCVSKLITAGGDSVAVRLPNNQFCFDLINQLGRPLVAPSANISNHNTATTYEDVVQDFQDRIPIIKGTCNKLASTIVEFSDDSINILREGAVSKTELKEYF